MTAVDRALQLLDRWGERGAVRDALPDIATAIREAVAAERERCALVAEEYAAEKWAAYKQGRGPDRADPRAEGASAGAEEIARRIRDGAPDAAPVWTTAAPVEPGWYWFRRSPDAAPECVEVTPPEHPTDDGEMLAQVVGHEDLYGTRDRRFNPSVGEWCGPLEVPK